MRWCGTLLELRQARHRLLRQGARQVSFASLCRRYDLAKEVGKVLEGYHRLRHLSPEAIGKELCFGRRLRFKLGRL